MSNNGTTQATVEQERGKQVGCNDIVLRLVDKQLAFDRAWKPLEDARIEFPPAFHVDVLDLVADLMGVPADNTVETNACERANETGEWPDDAYCRDWVWNMWSDVVDGSLSVSSFIAELAKPDPE